MDVKDDAGRTALDWALAKGDSKTTRLLRSAGAVAMAHSPASPPAVSTPRQVRVAVELALKQLQPAVRAFKEKAPCISCHNQSLPAVAVKLASSRGVPVDAEISKLPTEATLKIGISRDGLSARRLIQLRDGQGSGDSGPLPR